MSDAEKLHGGRHIECKQKNRQEAMQAKPSGYDCKCTAGKDTNMCAGRHEDFNAYKVQADNIHE
jgi:hypothetical protein